MHELSIAQGLVEVACEALAKCEPAPARVGSLRVRIGGLAGVVPDALEFCYGLSVEGTPLAGSRLVIEPQPVVVFCPRCLENRTLEGDFRFRCPVCDTPTPELVHGRELELISMELIDHDEPTRDYESSLDREPASPDPGGAPGAAEG
jgi:hydrogenase nickel incorporation protein HypA/HybF